MGERQDCAAPWEVAPPHEQLVVLITGANSGVGLGIAQRLMDEFLATRPPSAHLVVLATTRSPAKCRQALRDLRTYAAQAAARAAPRLARRRCGSAPADDDDQADADAAAREAHARLHVLSLPLDLCDLRAVRAFARALVGGRVGGPAASDDDDDDAPLLLRRQPGMRISRLDCVILNAAYGGWTGTDYARAAWSLLAKGLVQSVTWPDFKRALPTCLLNEQPAYGYPPTPPLGEVFAACVFGHYMLVHELLPLLRRPPCLQHLLPPARIVWSSSLEAVGPVFALDDLQCLARPMAYESAKRLIDLIALTHSLPAARPYSARWLAVDHGDGDGDGDEPGDAQAQPPAVYVTHPGIVASTIFPVPWFLVWAYRLALLLSRWLGSPWHTIEGYSGAKATAWITLQPRDALDARAAHRVKWGSCADRHGRVDVKMTEVDGWGWDGSIGRSVAAGKDDDDDQSASAPAFLLKSVGRKHGAVDATAEDITRFEELGAACWRDMEALRAQWNDILDGLDEPAKQA